jgi:hypothetical protein
MLGKPFDTGLKTQHGRKLWRAPDNSVYSERSQTFQGSDGLWYNVPSVDRNGADIPSNILEDWVQKAKKPLHDPLTHENIQSYMSLNNAEADSVARSQNMQVPAFPSRGTSPQMQSLQDFFLSALLGWGRK